MTLYNYKNINKYVWSYSNKVLEIHVDSYMCNQGIKAMYLGFFHERDYKDYQIKAVYK